jgi:hypothetical protein
MFHRCRLGESSAIVRLKLEVRDEADVDGVTPEAGYPGEINLAHGPAGK